MANYRRANIAGATYSFTVNLADRREALLTEHIGLLRAAFQYVQERHPYTTEAIAILPDHLHVIWTSPPGDADFSTRWRLLKTSFHASCPARNRARQAAFPRGSAAYGSAAIGSI